jgi:hypothetical protein
LAISGTFRVAWIWKADCIPESQMDEERLDHAGRVPKLHASEGRVCE